MVGYKPSYTIGHSKNKGPSFPYLSHCGPLTQSVDDAVIYMRYLSQYTQKLAYLDFSDEYIKDIESIKGLNIAVSKNLDGIVDYVDDQVWNKTMDVVKYFESKGANIEFVEPGLSKTKLNYFECLRKLWYLAMKGYGEYLDNYKLDEQREMVDPGLLKCIDGANKMNDINELIDIIQCRDQIKFIMEEFHKKYDLLIIPTCALLPPLAEAYDKDGMMKDMNSGKMVSVWDCHHSNMVFTSLCNLTGQPALSMPSGYVSTENGKIPIGVQIIGGMNKDNDVLRAGYCLVQRFQSLQAKL